MRRGFQRPPALPSALRARHLEVAQGCRLKHLGRPNFAYYWLDIDESAVGVDVRER